MALRRHVIPADNSCLFGAVALALGAEDLRELVAGLILSDPESWSEAMLGRPPEAYAEWIQEKEHWGGGIELAVLARHFETEMATVDVQTLRVSIFGELEGYEQRVWLIYDGIHYDLLVRPGPEGAQRTGFSQLFDRF